MVQAGLLKNDYGHFRAIFLKQNVEVLEHLDRHSEQVKGNAREGLQADIVVEDMGGDFLDEQYRQKGC